MAGTSFIEINKSALANNLQFLQNYFDNKLLLIKSQYGITITLPSFVNFSNQLNYKLLARLPFNNSGKVIN